jgi:hypothetical protein
VKLRARHDGWTVDKQCAFIEALAETGIVEEACRRVGMSRTAADNLRRRPCGAPFRLAWDMAVDYSLYRIEEDAFTRSRHGVARPIFHKGEQVGEYRHFDERLTMFLLRSFRPERYGKALDRLLAADDGEHQDEYARNDPGLALEGELTGIEFLAEDVPPDDEEEGGGDGPREP